VRTAETTGSSARPRSVSEYSTRTGWSLTISRSTSPPSSSCNEGDEVELIFDGAGTQWVPELEDEDNDNHELYRAVREDTAVIVPSTINGW
jgi:hypothetical protein